MSEKVGRNDPCPCGSGKKYKQCCLSKEPKRSGLAGRKFTAKVLSAGGSYKPTESQKQQEEANQAIADYNTLMERSFGNAIHSSDQPPPMGDPSEFLEKKDR